MNIPIYKAERLVGLEEKIRTQASISYASELKVMQPAIMAAAATNEKAEIALKQALATNQGQIDLHYLDTILATVGWNKNDDVFDRIETWIARATPEDKPFNLEHDPRRIIGHITGNHVINDSGELVKEDISLDDLPTKYHVVTSAVLYKFLKSNDEELEKQMKQIIAEIAKGEWFVSMECLFANFDYAVIGPDKSTKVVPRNEESAFLTKHLRAYGGDGVYDKYKIGRLLRNITFSGKGLVKKPANPESIIFRDVASFKVSKPEITQIIASSGYMTLSDNDSHKESNRMADVNADVLQAELKSTQSTLVTVQKKNEELEKRLSELNEKQVQAKIDDLSGQVKAKDEKVTALETQVKVEQTARTEADTKVKTLTEENTKLKTELDSVKAEKTKATRIAQWIERTGVETAVATKAVDSLTALSDESFKTFLETQPAKATTITPPPVEDKTKKDDKSGADNAQASVIDNAEPNKKDNVGAAGGVDTNVEQTRASIGKFIGENFLRPNRKTQRANKAE